MAKADIAALLALGAAFFIAIGDVIHQHSAHEVTDEPVSHLELFTRL
ncbi:MAG: DMT family transporter, partial [Mycobacterium sp.]